MEIILKWQRLNIYVSYLWNSLLIFGTERHSIICYSTQVVDRTDELCDTIKDEIQFLID